MCLTTGVHFCVGTLHVGKKLKKRNRKLYYATKWTIFAAILAAIFVPWRML